VGDFRLQSDFLTHHKVRRLRARVGPDGVLAWLGLIGYAAANKPDGHLTGLTADDIAMVADWKGGADFIAALVDLRLLDRHGKTFSLHNWSKRQPWVMASEQRRAKAQKAASVRWEKRGIPTGTGVSDDSIGNARSNATSIQSECSEHARSNAPYLTLPNLTEPKIAPLSEEANRSTSKPCKKPDQYETWLTTILLPAFPTKGRCQQKSALRFLRETKPSPAELEAYLQRAEQWAPIWGAGGWCPGFHSFLSEGKYREAPEPFFSKSDRNGSNGTHQRPASAQMLTSKELEQRDHERLAAARAEKLN
jgi:hypothetical protein